MVTTLENAISELESQFEACQEIKVDTVLLSSDMEEGDERTALLVQ